MTLEYTEERARRKSSAEVSPARLKAAFSACVATPTWWPASKSRENDWPDNESGKRAVRKLWSKHAAVRRIEAAIDASWSRRWYCYPCSATSTRPGWAFHRATYYASNRVYVLLVVLDFYKLPLPFAHPSCSAMPLLSSAFSLTPPFCRDNATSFQSANFIYREITTLLTMRSADKRLRNAVTRSIPSGDDWLRIRSPIFRTLDWKISLESTVKWLNLECNFFGTVQLKFVTNAISCIILFIMFTLKRIIQWNMSIFRAEDHLKTSTSSSTRWQQSTGWRPIVIRF